MHTFILIDNLIESEEASFAMQGMLYFVAGGGGSAQEGDTSFQICCGATTGQPEIIPVPIIDRTVFQDRMAESVNFYVFHLRFFIHT